jgi:hypothetical protein
MLLWGGMAMANAPGREPWTYEQVTNVVRRGYWRDTGTRT